jgi:hypothetical protein
MLALILLGIAVLLLFLIPGLLESAVGKFYHSSNRQQYLPDAILQAAIACPYCRNQITAEEAIVRCTSCETLHHFECWNAAGCCSVFGCKGKIERLL